MFLRESFVFYHFATSHKFIGASRVGNGDEMMVDVCIEYSNSALKYKGKCRGH
jgi:hypothetical protein